MTAIRIVDAGSFRASVLCGLIGQGISGSRSPEIHEREARALGIPMVYRILDADVLGYDADGLAQLLDQLAAMGFDGVNVTHPFKQAVLPLLDGLSDAASALGAVNTILFRDGRRHGDNTDWSGYRAHFLAGLGDRPRTRVALIGAGGAAAAVGYAHCDLGAQSLAIFDPAPERAYALAQRLGALFPKVQMRVAATAAEALAGAEGVVQASPIGMLSHPGLPFPPQLLEPAMWVSDIIYFPLETELLKAAATKGCATLNGGGMVVMQAAQAFALFTGNEAERDRMLAEFAVSSARKAAP
ncbi:shikimate dehydrogenase [Sphingobium sp. H39-3-25]|uniref:shikimate dehydrogenase n=1 Tax=Sphingobium arseniciresistens TaxID=3030834 RepID=UPI0023B9215D|nr:shikimate dehydrogenase [Sphingobium arseniciresistens]